MESGGGWRNGAERLAPAYRTEAARHAEKLAPVIAEVRAAGASSLRQIAARLNQRGIRTAQGAAWLPMQVKRVIERASRWHCGAGNVVRTATSCAPQLFALSGCSLSTRRRRSAAVHSPHTRHAAMMLKAANDNTPAWAPL